LKPNARTGPTQPVRPSSASRPIPAGRLWLFRIAALLLPVLLLGLLEVALRLAGYGYNPNFLQKTRIQGREYFINNDTFSRRFFPPNLARWPEPLKVPVVKPPDTMRILIFGESAAMGDPQPAYGAGRYLEVLLRERYPEKHFEVVNLAFTAINSHVILPIARECAQLDADAWIIYMGNNEMVGPFGAATVFGRQSPPRSLIQWNLALQRWRIGQLVMAGWRRLAGSPANAAWGGMRMFLQNQIPPGDPRRETAYHNFEANLRDILRLGLGSGAQVILNTMSVNLKDCPPFASLPNTNLPAADRNAFQKLYTEARELDQQGQRVAAAKGYAAAAELDPAFAELQFRWAACFLPASNIAARTHYQSACDLDALPFRADSRINEIIRRSGRQFHEARVELCDPETALAAACANGIAGDEIFFEHVHFNFHGNYLLGRLWAGQIAQRLGDRLGKAASPEWASAEVCERDLGLTLWNRRFVLDSVIRRMKQAPLDQQFNNPTRLAVLQAESDRLRAESIKTNVVMQSGQTLVDAIQRAPSDPYLHKGLANLYEALGDRPRAAEEYRRVLDLMPHDAYASQQLGRLLGELGQPQAGEIILRQAARQRPSLPEVWSLLGDVCLRQRRNSQALTAYQQAATLQPHAAAYAAAVATALARLNRPDQAIAEYRRAIEMQPNFQAAHFELAGLLVAENRLTEAEKEYAEAVRLDPRHVVSRINLGVVLTRQGRREEAIQQFQIALQLDPANAAARDYLRQVTEQRNQTR